MHLQNRDAVFQDTLRRRPGPLWYAAKDVSAARELPICAALEVAALVAEGNIFSQFDALHFLKPAWLERHPFLGRLHDREGRAGESAGGSGGEISTFARGRSFVKPLRQGEREGARGGEQVGQGMADLARLTLLVLEPLLLAVGVVVPAVLKSTLVGAQAAVCGRVHCGLQDFIEEHTEARHVVPEEAAPSAASRAAAGRA